MKKLALIFMLLVTSAIIAQNLDFLKSNSIINYGICDNYEQYGEKWIYVNLKLKANQILTFPDGTYIKKASSLYEYYYFYIYCQYEHSKEMEMIPGSSLFIYDFIHELTNEKCRKIEQTKFNEIGWIYEPILSIKTDKNAEIEIIIKKQKPHEPDPEKKN